MNKTTNSKPFVLAMLFAAIAALCILLAVGNVGAQTTTNPLVNPGFEDDGTGTNDPTGWSSSGDTDTEYTESGGYSGNYRLAFWSSAAYTVETFQTVTGLSDGSHTLRVWAKSSGDQNEAYIALRDCGVAEQRTEIPQTSDTTWSQFSVSADVSGGSCTVVFGTDANGGNWMNFDDATLTDDSAPTPSPTPTASPVPLPTKSAPLEIRGADISSLDKSEQMGGIYRDSNGDEADALTVLSDHGMNYIRLRVWVDPADGYHTKARILPIVQRAHAAGLKVLIDFHYSDFWADPGRQDIPAAWSSYDLTQMQTAIYDHTRDVCDALVTQGTPPDMVQVGNEINGGMVWPIGALSTYNWEFEELSQLLKEGIRAVNDCSPSTRIMLHLAEAGNRDTLEWWYGGVIAQGVEFDVIGLSYYPYWHGTLANLQISLDSLATTFDKDIVIVETAYPFVIGENDTHTNIVIEESMLIPGYPATQEGQQVFTRQMMNIINAIPNERGIGIFWWDATWTAVTGNGWDPTDPSSGNAWENQALFDYNSEPVLAMQEFVEELPTSVALTEAGQAQSGNALLLAIAGAVLVGAAGLALFLLRRN